MEARGLFWDFLEGLEKKVKSALEELGEEKAFHMVDVHVNAILALKSAVENSYGPGELSRSLFFSCLDSITVSLLWAQLALLAQSCQLAFRELRWALELSCRSRLLDLLYPHDEPSRKLLKGLSLERKRREVLPPGWRLVKKALEALRDFELERDERLRVRKAWKELNRYVHAMPPSASYAEVVDRLLRVSDVVSDVVITLALDAFPRAREKAAAFFSGKAWGRHLPMTYRYLRPYVR